MKVESMPVSNTDMSKETCIHQKRPMNETYRTCSEKCSRLWLKVERMHLSRINMSKETGIHQKRPIRKDSFFQAFEAVVEGREHGYVEYKHVKRDLYTPKETYKRDERTAFVNVLTQVGYIVILVELQHTTTHCNTPQHTATHHNTLQHT